MPKARSVEDGEEIKRLREEIAFLRQAVRRLLPEKAADLLSSYHDCGSLDDAIRWEATVAEQVLDLAEARPGREMGSPLGLVERAYCPLCKGSSQSPYQKGFAFPDGLLKHLRGERSAHECLIMREARMWALDYVQDEFAQRLRRRLGQRSSSAGKTDER
jgi:hypothetical protein